MPRGDAPAPVLLWPEGLLRPTPGQRLVYLDFNHWVYLAKAAVGLPHGEPYQRALQQCRAAKASGRTIFPLSGAHYMEMAGVRDPAQRRNVAAVMEELSDFQTIVNRTTVVRLELDTVLTHYISPPSTPLATIPLLGFGCGPAFGMVGGLRIRDGEGNDVTDEVRRRAGPDFDAKLAEATLQLERGVLKGPEDNEVPALQANGWDPTVAKRIAQRRADQEVDLQDQLASTPDFAKWQRGERLRDVVLAREVLIELREFLDEALALRGMNFTQIVGDEPGTAPSRNLVRAMPSSEVATALKTEDHRNRDKRWESNDIFDIDALALAVPYCDVVVTDGHRAHVLRAAGLGNRMNAVVLSHLNQLADYFDKETSASD